MLSNQHQVDTNITKNMEQAPEHDNLKIEYYVPLSIFGEMKNNMRLVRRTITTFTNGSSNYRSKSYSIKPFERLSYLLCAGGDPSNNADWGCHIGYDDLDAWSADRSDWPVGTPLNKCGGIDPDGAMSDSMHYLLYYHDDGMFVLNGPSLIELIKSERTVPFKSLEELKKVLGK